MINYGRQFIDKKDKKAVIDTLGSSLITQGEKVNKFQNLLAKKYGSKYCSVLSSGTAALHLLGLALGWKKNDIVLTTPISFLATSNCILYTGAKPVFVDIDESTSNIDPSRLEKKIKSLKKKKKKIKAIICTDYAGHPCDWKKLKKISSTYKVKLINDNCHAIGASIENDKKYAIKYADFVTLSFHAVKHITTGEGGAVISNDKSIINKINILKTHGVIKKNQKKIWFYEMQHLGFNYRITDFQCALGISQLLKLNKFIKRRKIIAKIYNKAFFDIKNISIPEVKKNFNHVYHLYPLKINFDNFKVSKEFFFKKLRKYGINLQVHYIPIHLQPYYKKNFKFKTGDFPKAEKFYEREVSLPIYFGLSNIDVKYVISKIKKILAVK
jgi:UDP-4-amino-4,6-dideoxy-N-acetyl-beta-L-altrosamine transaminase